VILTLPWWLSKSTTILDSKQGPLLSLAFTSTPSF
jgi:hypothetical protein